MNMAAQMLQPMDDDLDAMFAQAPAETEDNLFMSLEVPKDVDVKATTPQYKLIEGQAILKQGARVLSMHFHVLNGEPMDEFYNPDSHLFDEPETCVFHT